MKASGMLRCLALVVFAVTAATARVSSDQPHDRITSRLRSLQETDAGGPVVSVATAQGLLDAVVAGEPHIEITEHLDLAVLPIIVPSDPTLTLATSLLGVLPPTVKSIRVLSFLGHDLYQPPACLNFRSTSDGLGTVSAVPLPA